MIPSYIGDYFFDHFSPAQQCFSCMTGIPNTPRTIYYRLLQTVTTWYRDSFTIVYTNMFLFMARRVYNTVYGNKIYNVFGRTHFRIKITPINSYKFAQIYIVIETDFYNICST